MSADTLALARLDDDGWGCAITAEPVSLTLCIACGEHLTDTEWHFDPCPHTQDGSHQREGMG